mmetsp:Transcript_7210/g.13395  ORF Transcript_7210/g.13395 Transcript_7210/m.13395 type:complete len:300 (+) Transcript_7210:69-968(+)
MTESIGQLKTRHKLEVRNLAKEFKAKLKSAKGKDKKREVKEQQKQAEKEMADRHKKELSEHESTTSDDKGTGESESQTQGQVAGAQEAMASMQVGEKKQTLSRAQRRRLKKQQKEEEQRKKDMAEAAKMVDWKQKEIDRLKEKLGPLGMDIHDIPADGNCLFRACAHQLDTLRGGEGGEDSKQEILSHGELRKKTGDVLLENEDSYRPYCLKDDGNLMSSGEFKAYCTKIASTSAWGGQAEIAAISRLTRRQIIVHSAFASDVKTGVPSDLEPLRIAFHQHYYSLGAHYNSVIPVKDSS